MVNKIGRGSLSHILWWSNKT